MKYQFSVGKGLRNNTPENKECESFEDLFKVVVNLSHKNKNPIKGGSQKDNDSIKKEGYWIGAPFSGRRAKHNALARQFVILDVDRCPKENRSQVKDYCKRWKSFVYSSFSSTDENPKFRIVVDASRSILPEEMETVTRYCNFSCLTLRERRVQTALRSIERLTQLIQKLEGLLRCYSRLTLVLESRVVSS